MLLTLETKTALDAPNTPCFSNGAGRLYLWYNRGMEFYSYLWLREDGSPYYAGKGSGKRAFVRHGRIYPPLQRSRIVLFSQESEADALASERALIWLFGRKDCGTGILRNLTDGGEGVSGMRHSETAKQQISRALAGHKTKGMTGQHHSEVTKQKMRQSSRGQVPWSKGLTLSDEHKRKLSLAATGRKMSVAAVEKMAAAKRGKPWSATRRKAHEAKYNGKF